MKKPASKISNKLLLKSRFKALIGIYKFERKHEQAVKLEVAIKSPVFIDYDELNSFCKKFIKKHEFFTLEKALQKLCKSLNKRYFIKELRLKISKPEALKKAQASYVLKCRLLAEQKRKKPKR